MKKISFCWLLSIQCILAQPTLHAFIVAETDDPQIGAITDFPKMQHLMTQIAETIDFQLDMKLFEKQATQPDSLINAIQKVKCEKDDVIWFYYTGHGYHAYDYGSGQYAGFRIGTNGFALEQIHDELKAHEPRLLITMYDCCNYRYFSQPNKIALKSTQSEYYIALFGNATGEIKMCSNRAAYHGTSYGSPETGGIFTAAFVKSLKQVTTGDLKNCNWNHLLEKTTQGTQLAAEADAKQQVPYYQIHLRQ